MLKRDEIAVDHNEYEHKKHQTIVASISNEVDVFKTTMRYGDYAFLAAPWPDLDRLPRVGIEVSKIDDVFGKVASGRFGDQMVGLLETYDLPLLLVQGVRAVDPRGRLQRTGRGAAWGPERRWSDLRAYEMVASFRGIRVMQTLDDFDTAKAILQIYHNLQEPFENHTLIRRPGLGYRVMSMPTGDPIDAQVYALMNTPLGEKQSRKALEAFGSFKGVVNAERSMLRMVEGIGPRTAQAFDEFVNLPYGKD